jgi:hypothetical protein
MTWFEALTGFCEISPDQVRENLAVNGDTLTSLVSRKKFTFGRLETPSLGELRKRVASSGHKIGKLSLREVIGDVTALHADESNAGALFQVASQFNLLEMTGPAVTPEMGVGRYENDHTQGPACAIAAGAGTIYRNYFAEVNGQVGQSSNNQIDCLADLGTALDNSGQRLWKMRNGYAWPTQEGLIEISRRLNVSSAEEIDQLRQLLRIGIQWNTQVTINNLEHTVTQAYCSAVPINYCRHIDGPWEPFARLVLEASYEATICTAILNSLNTGNNRVFLTLVGGSAFGNEISWITESLQRALQFYENWNLDIALVSFKGSDHNVRQLVEQFS